MLGFRALEAHGGRRRDARRAIEAVPERLGSGVPTDVNRGTARFGPGVWMASGAERAERIEHRSDHPTRRRVTRPPKTAARAFSPGRSTRRWSPRVGGSAKGFAVANVTAAVRGSGPFLLVFPFDTDPGTGRWRREALRRVRAANERSRPASSRPFPRPGREADRRGRGRSVPWRAAACRPSVRGP